jgi:hypothetical protein
MVNGMIGTEESEQQFPGKKGKEDGENEWKSRDHLVSW